MRGAMLVFALLVIAALPGAASCATLRIALLGDSLTRGNASHERHPPSFTRGRGNLASELAALLGARSAVSVRNFGSSGATAMCCQPRSYAEKPEFDAAMKFRPHVIVLMLGTNDGISAARDRGIEQMLRLRRKRVSERRSQASASAAVRARAYTSGIRHLALHLLSQDPVPALLLMRPPPLAANESSWGHTQELIRVVHRAFRNAARKLTAAAAGTAWCASGAVGVADSGTRLGPCGHCDDPRRRQPGDCCDLFFSDWVHLRAAGTARLAEAIAPSLRSCLSAMPCPSAKK
eukprot:TRINITY_DN25454_c0_g1_i1.p1 TRINITY_DN25454_c0_g1~~TRINITY_DN25454_c0_g1_i1.p1  ORF type:complete len:292 (+),score=55.54 TRINITY_DN25454_c0_g1_i1:61-936(+)